MSRFTSIRQSLAEKSRHEIVDALENLYEVFDSSVIEWFVSLYDEKIGGFYFSASARDTEGFLPDIESTMQALGYINACGMPSQLGIKSYKEFIPENMKARIISFTKSLQDPNDGYFYHPQWGKNIISSRRSRDLSWSISVLENLDALPTYDAPDGTRGDGILPSGERLPFLSHISDESGRGSVLAASKLLFRNEIDERLQSKDSFLAYLNDSFGENASFPIRRYSDPVINELTSLGTVIRERDRLLRTKGKPTIAPLLTEWLEQRQNEFGHWQYKTDTEGNLILENGRYIPLTDYSACNAISKAATLYSTLGYKMPRTNEAAKAAISALFSKEPLNSISDIYNAWFSLNAIRNNLINFGGVEGKKEYKMLQKKLLSLAPSAIEITKNKLSLFRMSDGSFSLSESHRSRGFSQNAHVAIKGIKEGEINSTRIALATVTDLYGALGISDHFVPIFEKNDAERYRDLLRLK